MPRISDDGKHVVFLTSATNIAAVDVNGGYDLCSVDVQTGALTLISFDKNAPTSTSQAGLLWLHSVSRNGRFVTFLSAGADIGLHADVFVRNLGPDFPDLYCSGKPSSQGCIPFLTFSGTASASSSQPFAIDGLRFLVGESGFLIYGVNGKSNLDFHGGKLCVKLPLSRWLPFKKAVKQGGAVCGGTLHRNFNARIQGGADPLLTAGQVVHAQWLQRDPNDPAGFGDGLSNGIRFTVGP